MKRHGLLALTAGLLVLSSVCAALPTATRAAEADPLDWPQWRGPENNGVSRETGLIDEWDPEAEGTSGNVLWRNEELGGISTPIVMRGKLYTIVRSDAGTPKDCEKVVCVDAATGKKIWERRNNIFLSDVPAERIGWANVVGDPTTGNVFAFGACGFLECLDGETGKPLWSHSLNEEYGILTTYGGRLTTPVVFEDLVIVGGVIIGWGDAARPTHRLLAFNKQDGQLVWINGTRPLPEDTTYSTPALCVLDGQAALVFGSGDGGVYAWQPRTGKPIWNFDLSIRGLNISPVVANDRVYMSHAEENAGDASVMGAIVCIDGKGMGNVSKTGEVWRAPGMVGKASPLVIEGRMYAFDDGGKVYVLDAATGKPVSKRPTKLVGTILVASPVYAGGKIYACTTSAWHVLEPTKDGVKIVQKMRLSAEDEVRGSPIVSHGRIYLPTAKQIYCLGRAESRPSEPQPADAKPDAAQEAPAGKDDAVAQVQLVPAEALLKPGDKQKLAIKLYNARGQFLRNADEAEFKLTGPGEMSPDGTFTAASDAGHKATIVTAQVNGVPGQARIRVVPDLPWKFDFAGGDVPVTWVGARYRNIVREVEGNPVMVKITTIPKGTRSQAIMGQNDLHDYTVQADVLGVPTNGKLPDAGVIAQRYTMDLMGDHQEIQIRSWTSQLDRFSKIVPFKWEGNTWYTIKFRAEASGGKAVLKGKVWKRGEAEPKEWTIEAVDEAPNLVGAPGLFGNAQTSEIFYDNIAVTPNQTK
jgi:outer membrane protein assembly factor BamB